MLIAFSFVFFVNVGSWKDTGERCAIFLLNGAATGKVNIRSG